MMCQKPDSWHLSFHGSQLCAYTLVRFVLVAMVIVSTLYHFLKNAGEDGLSVKLRISLGEVLLSWDLNPVFHTSSKCPNSEFPLEPRFLNDKISSNSSISCYFFSFYVFLLVVIIMFNCGSYIL